MDLETYKDLYGWDTIRRLCKKLKISEGYMRHLVYNRQIPSSKLAVKLVDATAGELDFWSMFNQSDKTISYEELVEQSAKIYKETHPPKERPQPHAEDLRDE